ncbi:MAG TPA: PGPGW domain-containing protein [Woeseiaceae bacterium]|nr:PGPGW domain-containing protein [Woeseiaceae bacterium]
MFNRIARITYKAARRIVVAVVGTTVLLLGVVMIVMPGPAFVVIPLGLAILSIEFAWARNWLRKVRTTISEQTAKVQSARAENHRSRNER